MVPLAQPLQVRQVVIIAASQVIAVSADSVAPRPIVKQSLTPSASPELHHIAALSPISWKS